MDTYTADLTKGHGDFWAGDTATYTARYEHDGYHLSVSTPEALAPATLKSPTPHLLLGAQVRAVGLQVPAGAGFGPSCWQDETHGYAFLIDGAGIPSLVEHAGQYGVEMSTLKTDAATAAVTGSEHTLLLTCDLVQPTAKTITLKGYVDGTKVIEVSTQTAMTEINFTGFTARTGSAAPAEWRATKFVRVSADNVPKD